MANLRGLDSLAVIVYTEYIKYKNKNMSYAYTFNTPTKKQKRLLKEKLEILNEQIDKKIEKGETNTPKYRNLIKIHYSLFCELETL